MDLRELNNDVRNRHPWELARVATLSEILRSVKLSDCSPNVLDIGCGDAFTISEICKAIPGAGIDALDINLTPDQLEGFSRQKPAIHFYNSYNDLGEKKYSLVTLFDVIEHINDDVGFLRAILGKHADQSTCFFLTVPAYQSLFSKHDRFLQHYRRYNLAALNSVIERAGGQVFDGGYLFFTLLPLRCLSVLLERAFHRSETENVQDGVGNWQHGPLLTKIIFRLLLVDNKISLLLGSWGIQLPGLTAWTLFRKKPL